MKELAVGVLLLVFWLVIVPTGVGLAWESWNDYSDRECQKSRECREHEAEIDRYVVDDEMPDAANQNYYRGE